MADCEKLINCAFFHDEMENMPSKAESMKKDYCQGNNEECARYMVCTKLGKEKVTDDLFPDMKETALSIIAQG